MQKVHDDDIYTAHEEALEAAAEGDVSASADHVRVRFDADAPLWQISYAEAYRNIRRAQLTEFQELNEALQDEHEDEEAPDWIKEHKQRQREGWAREAKYERDAKVYHHGTCHLPCLTILL